MNIWIERCFELHPLLYRALKFQTADIKIPFLSLLQEERILRYVHLSSHSQIAKLHTFHNFNPIQLGERKVPAPTFNAYNSFKIPPNATKLCELI